MCHTVKIVWKERAGSTEGALRSSVRFNHGRLLHAADAVLDCFFLYLCLFKCSRCKAYPSTSCITRLPSGKANWSCNFNKIAGSEHVRKHPFHGARRQFQPSCFTAKTPDGLGFLRVKPGRPCHRSYFHVQHAGADQFIMS